MTQGNLRIAIIDDGVEVQVTDLDPIKRVRVKQEINKLLRELAEKPENNPAKHDPWDTIANGAY